ncbi:MAG: hypothetical protein J6H31_07790 [Butyrivibrio sp.]|nr:hypothetical protein [Butyrivibrio sp.]
MAKYKIIYEGDEQDEIFDTYDEANDYALYLVSCYYEGSEVLEMRDPVEFAYDPYDEPEYEIIEVDD